jgi:hypothetical protein
MSYGFSCGCPTSFNPFQSLMPDFLKKKKKESVSVPASSQRQQASPSTSATQTTVEAVPSSSASNEVAVGASEDIFAQADKLEEDMGISRKKKAKEVRDQSPW